MSKKIISIGLMIGYLTAGIYLTDKLFNANTPTISVKFSPNGGVIEQLVEEINKTDLTIKVICFSFTHPKIADALIRAKNRGVKVEVVADEVELANKNSVVPRLKENGISIWLDGKHAIQHNKVMILDEKEVVTGSCNFTISCDERNGENQLYIQDRKLAATFQENWILHQQHSSRLN